MIRPELFHPMIIHFPIVMILLAYLCFLLSMILQKDYLDMGFRWLLGLGALSSIVAVITGHIAEENAVHSDAAHEILTKLHEPLATIVMIVSILLVIWGLNSKWNFSKIAQYLYLLVFTAIVLLITATAHFGAMLVYEHGIGVNPDRLKPLEHTHSEEHKSNSAGDPHDDHDH